MQQKTSPKDSKNKTTNKIRHVFEYAQFITWIATPIELREPKTQAELSNKFGVGQDTLSEWKKQINFWEKVKEKRISWGHERTPDVVLALYNRIKKTGDPMAVKLWLQHIENWSEKFIVKEENGRDKYRHLTDAELAVTIQKRLNFFKKK